MKKFMVIVVSTLIIMQTNVMAMMDANVKLMPPTLAQLNKQTKEKNIAAEALISLANSSSNQVDSDGDQSMLPPTTEMTNHIKFNRLLKDALNRKELATAFNLIVQGANPNIKDATGRTLLMIAMTYGNANIDVIDTLLDLQGIDVNLQDNEGYTALMFALTYLTETPTPGSDFPCLTHVIDKLVENEAHFLIENNAGQTAREVAIEIGQPRDIIMQLIGHEDFELGDEE